jgi:hypothetical protein
MPLGIVEKSVRSCVMRPYVVRCVSVVLLMLCLPLELLSLFLPATLVLSTLSALGLVATSLWAPVSRHAQVE